ncbi:MAG: DUF72 domain-containing protein [Anaerolineae bacterium]
MDEEKHPKLWIGTSGWVYPHWRGVFYPQDLATSMWLPYYTRHFPTVEVNNSFYRLPSETAFRAWGEAVPPRFRFAVKANRYLTHMKKLRDVAEPLERFLGRARLLGEKLGPILYQLPPNWNCNLPRLREFLALLPEDLQHVFEFRNTTWLSEEVFAALEAHGVAFCVISLPDFPCPVRATAPLVYVRMHGSGLVYGGCYSEEELQGWAGEIRRFLAEGHEVYVYFNNDAFGYAVQNARRLRELLERT